MAFLLSFPESGVVAPGTDATYELSEVFDDLEGITPPRHRPVEEPTAENKFFNLIFGYGIDEPLVDSSLYDELEDEVVGEETFAVIPDDCIVRPSEINMSRLDDYLVVEEVEYELGEHDDFGLVGPKRESAGLGAFIARAHVERARRYWGERKGSMSRQDRLKIDRRSALL